MQKKKIKLKKKVIFQSIAFLVAFISVILLVRFIKLNIFPFFYLSILVILLIGIDFLLFFIMSKKNYKLRMIGTVLCIFFMTSYSFIIHYESKTVDFLESIAALNIQKEVYHVIVNKDSSYQSLEDLKNKKVSFVDDRVGVKKGIKEIEKVINIKKITKKDTSSLLEDINTHNSEAALILEDELKIYTEISSQYSETVRVLESIEVEVPKESTLKEVEITKEPFSIYVTGIDTFGDLNVVSRSDVNMVITVNPMTHKILLTSIPRDYYVQIDNTNGLKDKLTHAGLKGVDTSIKTIESLLNTNINYYMKINFSSLIQIVDAVEGVDVFNPFAFTANYVGPLESVYYEFPEGNIHLDGARALAYSRERYCLREGDIARARHQQQVIRGLVDKLMSPMILTKYTKLLRGIEGNFETNLSLSSITGFIQKQIKEMSSWTIDNDVLSGSFASEYTASFPTLYSEVLIPDEESVESSIQKIKMLKEER